MRIGRVVGHAPRRPDSPSPYIHRALSDPPPRSPLPKLTRGQNWREWAYTYGSYHIHHGKQVIVAGFYHPASDSPNYVQPNGAGITNTIVRAELAAIAASILQGHSCIATDSLSSLNQIRKQILHLELHRQHVQGHILKIIIQLVRNSPTPIYLYKVESHAGIAGNECADAIAKHQAIQDNDAPEGTTFPCANLEGNPFHDTTWLAFKEIPRTHANTSGSLVLPAVKLKRFSNLHDALQTHMHSKHRLGKAKPTQDTTLSTKVCFPTFINISIMPSGPCQNFLTK
eukprot:1156298-Pelagomonas_calceolata.AAC.1